MIMKTIKLSDEDLAFLREIGFREPNLGILVSRWFSGSGKNKVFSLPSDVSEEFRSLFTLKLAKSGFDKNYALNINGIVLERLIDIFA